MKQEGLVFEKKKKISGGKLDSRLSASTMTLDNPLLFHFLPLIKHCYMLFNATYFFYLKT